MYDLSSSPTSVVAHGYESATGGTCFLDLPLELRRMIYDLSMADQHEWKLPLPGQPKSRVMGINLLQSCKQIRQETHSRVWNRGWPLWFPADTSSIDLGFATSSLNDFALAKIRTIYLQIQIDPGNLFSWGPVNLDALPTFKVLSWLSVRVQLGNYDKRTTFEQSDVRKSVYLKGLVIQILLRIPQQVLVVLWNLTFWNNQGFQSSVALKDIAEEYKHLQGSDYLPKVSNSYDLSSSPSP